MLVTIIVPGDCHVRRVATEGGHVVLDPSQRGDHLEAPAFVRRVGQARQPGDAEAIVLSSSIEVLRLLAQATPPDLRARDVGSVVIGLVDAPLA